MIIIHDALDLSVQGAKPPPEKGTQGRPQLHPDMGPQGPPDPPPRPASDIWRLSPETCSKLFTSAPPSPTGADI